MPSGVTLTRVVWATDALAAGPAAGGSLGHPAPHLTVVAAHTLWTPALVDASALAAIEARNDAFSYKKHFIIFGFWKN